MSLRCASLLLAGAISALSASPASACTLGPEYGERVSFELRLQMLRQVEARFVQLTSENFESNGAALIRVNGELETEDGSRLAVFFNRPEEAVISCGANPVLPWESGHSGTFYLEEEQDGKSRIVHWQMPLTTASGEQAR